MLTPIPPQHRFRGVIRPKNPVFVLELGSISRTKAKGCAPSSGSRSLLLTRVCGGDAAACGKLVTTSAETNVYDLSVEAGVALRDLLSLNPSIVPDASLTPGTQLARPCYVSGAPTYLGADIAQVRSLTSRHAGPV